MIGIIVGLVTFRDQLVQELGDGAAAIGNLNQSYSIAITGPNPPITVGGPNGTTVTVTKTYPNVNLTATFENFSYTDQRDYCTPAVAQSPGTPPAGIDINVAIAKNEGVALP